ncbi:helix-turn-helix transcriptional regulator [Hymenobacter sp. BT664]|uniref:Helix-turn-helix transcriptional regulator n=1 Tax=Hymenobacter montanus TaxID=2771359 RepID=A0A927BGR2_9BACT|nr:helix-turn-helix transcriptional regulator [Hymenobacter montanus]MBD2769864.1 helix-turn-helix transcriptional regulator [Hymenobacter montanus]
MTLSLTVYLFCVSLATANLVMAAVLLLALRKARNRHANRTLSLLMLCLAASFFLGDILYCTPFFEHYPHLIEYDPFLSMCLGPLLYFYILYQTRPDFRLRPRHLLHLLPLPGYFILLWGFYTSDASTKLAYLKLKDWSTIPHFALAPYFREVQLFAYGVACYRLLVRHGRVMRELVSSIDDQQLRWLRHLLLMAAGLFAVWIVSNEFSNTSNMLGIALLFFSYWVPYHAIAQEYIFAKVGAETVLPIIQKIEEAKEVRYRNSTLSPEDIHGLMERLAGHMAHAKPHLDSDLSLTALAEQVQLNPNHLSQVLNEGFGESFYKFVNRHRVEQSKHLLRDPAFAHYSMLGIAYQAGFSAKSTFYKAFKEAVGCSPSEFMKSEV